MRCENIPLLGTAMKHFKVLQDFFRNLLSPAHQSIIFCFPAIFY